MDGPASPIIPHRAWQRARRDLAQAFAGGPGLIVVLGRRGTGKSLLLAELSQLLAVGDVPARIRTPAATRPPDLALDIVDDVGAAALRILAAEPNPPKLRIIAARADHPAIAATLAGLSPNPRIVELDALDTEDVRIFLRARLAAHSLPTDTLTPEAIAGIHAASGGNPAALDTIATAAIHQAAQGQPVPPPRPNTELAAPRPAVYQSVIAELAALTAADEQARVAQARRRRRYRVAAAIIGLAAVGAAASANGDRLSSAVDTATAAILRFAQRTSQGPSMIALRP